MPIVDGEGLSIIQPQRELRFVHESSFKPKKIKQMSNNEEEVEEENDGGFDLFGDDFDDDDSPAQQQNVQQKVQQEVQTQVSLPLLPNGKATKVTTTFYS